MKYGYRITVNLIPNESGYDSYRHMAVCCIENKNNFDTITQAEKTMEDFALKLNIKHPFYIESKEILIKDKYKDSLINIKADELGPELKNFMFDLIEKMVKKHG